MDINAAKALKPGDTVRCPYDRGDAPHHASVSHVGAEVYSNLDGREYIWITVKRLDGRPGGGVWPSNRLG